MKDTALVSNFSSVLWQEKQNILPSYPLHLFVFTSSTQNFVRVPNFWRAKLQKETRFLAYFTFRISLQYAVRLEVRIVTLKAFLVKTLRFFQNKEDFNSKFSQWCFYHVAPQKQNPFFVLERKEQSQLSKKKIKPKIFMWFDTTTDNC